MYQYLINYLMLDVVKAEAEMMMVVVELVTEESLVMEKDHLINIEK